MIYCNVGTIAPPSKFGSFEEPVAGLGVSTGDIVSASVNVAEAQGSETGCSSLVSPTKMEGSQSAHLVFPQVESAVHRE